MEKAAKISDGDLKCCISGLEDAAADLSTGDSDGILTNEK